MATTAVVVREPKRRRARARTTSRGRKISLGVIAGLAPGVLFALEPVQQGRTWDESFQRLIAAYTGYSYGERKWSSFYLTKGLAPLAGGFLAHYLADAFGVNRMIARLKLPVEI